MRKTLLVVALLFVAVNVYAQCSRCPSKNLFWVAVPFHSFSEASAFYLASPPGSVAPLATGDADFPFVMVQRVESDFTLTLEPYRAEVAVGCVAGDRVVTTPDGTILRIVRAKGHEDDLRRRPTR